MHVATVTIDHTKVPSNQTDFVVYINLAHMPSSFWNTVANGGGDIRCYKSDGTTELAREVVSCDTATQTGELHVKYAGTLSSTVDTQIQIHANGTSSDYSVTGTYGRNAVWSDFELVSHDGGAGDSTGNHTPTAYGGVTSGGVDAVVGKGTEYDGVNDYVSVGSTLFSASFYISTVVKAASTGGLGGYIGRGADGYGDGWSVYMGAIDGEKISSAIVTTVPSVSQKTAEATIDAVAGTWYHHATRWNSGTGFYQYINGVQNGSIATTATGLRTSSVGVEYGKARSPTPVYSDATLDEIRIRTDVANTTDDYVETENNNLMSAGTFYRIKSPYTPQVMWFS